MADLLTIYERTPDFSKVTVTWVGDGNNMANSWIEAAMYFPFQLNMAIAPGYDPISSFSPLRSSPARRSFLTHDPKLAVDGANYIYADVWASMGQEEEQKKQRGSLQGLLRGQRTHEPRRSRRQVPALPARPSRRGSDRRGHGKRSLHCLG